MSDTPRTEAVNQYLRTRRDYTKTDHEVWMNHGIQLERELNEANYRIKRLEEAGDGLLAALKDDWSEYVEWINESTDAVGKWNRAKESKQ